MIENIRTAEGKSCKRQREAQYAQWPVYLILSGTLGRDWSNH
jgi:hypothetical protein